MSIHLIKNYPKYYEYFKETTFTWDRTGGDPITQGNRNPLLYKNIGVDGIKTGYLAVEKYSLAASIKNGERRLISVGSGFETKSSRSKETRKILSWGLRTFDTIEVAKQGVPFTFFDVWLGKKHNVEGYVKEDIYLTVPKRKKDIIKAVVEYTGPIEAPIKKNDKLGVLNVFLEDELIKELDIYSNSDVKRLNVFYRLIKYMNYLVWGDV